ncbi:MAG: nucleotidyltransferase domain-containing protein [Nitrospirae bacterium]|nr:nucleotidyltransferase domain-containing protein [Nitrospirota bacterium]
MIDDSDTDKLKNYFQAHQDIAFAFLFGSQATGKATKLSDVDIAVYFYPDRRHPVEYEEEKFYNAEDKVRSALEKVLKRDVEMLVLNRASSTVAASAIRGLSLAINDWGLYLDFMEVVTREAEDFREMVFKDFLERMTVERRA